MSDRFARVAQTLFRSSNGNQGMESCVSRDRLESAGRTRVGGSQTNTGDVHDSSLRSVRWAGPIVAVVIVVPAYAVITGGGKATPRG